MIAYMLFKLINIVIYWFKEKKNDYNLVKKHMLKNTKR